MNPASVPKYLMGGSKEGGVRLFSVVPSTQQQHNTQWTQSDLQEMPFKRVFFLITVSMVKQWNRSLGKAADFPSLEILKT